MHALRSTTVIRLRLRSWKKLHPLRTWRPLTNRVLHTASVRGSK